MHASAILQQREQQRALAEREHQPQPPQQQHNYQHWQQHQQQHQQQQPAQFMFAGGGLPREPGATAAGQPPPLQEQLGASQLGTTSQLGASMLAPRVQRPPDIAGQCPPPARPPQAPQPASHPSQFAVAPWQMQSGAQQHERVQTLGDLMTQIDDFGPGTHSVTLPPAPSRLFGHGLPSQSLSLPGFSSLGMGPMSAMYQQPLDSGGGMLPPHTQQQQQAADSRPHTNAQRPPQQSPFFQRASLEQLAPQGGVASRGGLSSVPAARGAAAPKALHAKPVAAAAAGARRQRRRKQGGDDASQGATSQEKRPPNKRSLASPRGRSGKPRKRSSAADADLASDEKKSGGTGEDAARPPQKRRKSSTKRTLAALPPGSARVPPALLDGNGTGADGASGAQRPTAVETNDEKGGGAGGGTSKDATALGAQRLDGTVDDSITDRRRKSGVGTRYLLFEQARDAVRAKGILSQREYWKWVQSGEKPADIPSNPHQVYRMYGWISWRDWLGTVPGAAPKRKSSEAGPMLSFDAALSKARALRFTRQQDWQTWCRQNKRPDDMPRQPHKAYKDAGWVSWDHWLGANEYASISVVRQHEQQCGVGPTSVTDAGTAPGPAAGDAAAHRARQAQPKPQHRGGGKPSDVPQHSPPPSHPSNARGDGAAAARQGAPGRGATDDNTKAKRADAMRISDANTSLQTSATATGGGGGGSGGAGGARSKKEHTPRAGSGRRVSGAGGASNKAVAAPARGDKNTPIHTAEMSDESDAAHVLCELHHESGVRRA